ADDDVHVAVFRLQGSAGTTAATARVTTALAPASDGTSLALELDLHPGPGSELTREGVLAALGEIVPAARAAGEGAGMLAAGAAPAPAAAEAATRGAAAAAPRTSPCPASPPPSPLAAPPTSPPPAADSSAPPAWSETVDWVEPGQPARERPAARRSP